MNTFVVIVRNVQTREYKYIVEANSADEASVIAKVRHTDGVEADDSWMLYDTEYVDYVEQQVEKP